MIEVDKWMTLKEAATYLNVSESWLYQKGPRAGVPRSKIGSTYRYLKSDLIGWMKEKASA